MRHAFDRSWQSFLDADCTKTRRHCAINIEQSQVELDI
jgi:hypothetical protein